MDVIMEASHRAFMAGLIKPGEFWFGLFDFPKYLVGSHGAVLSFVSSKPKMLSPIRRGKYDGYTLLNRDGKLVRVYRHRLVAEAVHGPCPPGAECLHLDHDKTNADHNNLAWGTHAENVQANVESGLAPAGEKNGASKLTSQAVAQMRAMRAGTGVTYREIGRRFGVSVMTAYRAIAGQAWRSVR